MRKLVFTVAAPKEGKPFKDHQYTLPAQYTYAQRVGADYKVISSVESPDRFHNNPTWYRIAELDRIKQTGEYEQVLYLDADAFPHPEAQDIF